jgi:hypothetical protein
MSRGEHHLHEHHQQKPLQAVREIDLQKRESF